MIARKPFDYDSYIQQIQTRPCFICEMLAGRLNGNRIVYRNDIFVAFLNKYPTVRGYMLVAPSVHKEHVTSDFTMDDYLELQRSVYQVAEAVKMTVETERMYILSLGSQQANSHVHWHIVPLPYGVPFRQQQTEAIKMRNGVIEISHEEMDELARSIRKNFEQIISQG